MRDFIDRGYVTVQTDFSPEFHANIWQQADELFATRGNPGNDIYPLIPELGQVLEHENVRGALSSILGDDYLLHPHRHCHLTPPGKAPQNNHQDTRVHDENVRHHRCRWAMAFYYPQDIDLPIGPTAVTPGSQFLNERDSLDCMDELSVVGPAGTVTIVHYDMWHRAIANMTDANRYMIKFLFCRLTEPNPSGTAGRSPVFEHHPDISRFVWDWYANNGKLGRHEPSGSATSHTETLLSSGKERDRLAASYTLGEAGEIDRLLDALSAEAQRKYGRNLDRSHTNVSQLDASFRLSIGGNKAVAALKEALDESNPALRASAADILGDTGHTAAPAIPGLIDRLEDESHWVRRNATESLGILGAQEAIPALTARIDDRDDRVRYNAILSLIKIGNPSDQTRRALQRSKAGPDAMAKALATIAYDRFAR